MLVPLEPRVADVPLGPGRAERHARLTGGDLYDVAAVRGDVGGTGRHVNRRTARAYGDAARERQRAEADVLDRRRAVERDADNVTGGAGGVGREHLARPEVAVPVEGAAEDGGQAAGPDVGGLKEALVGVRVDPVDVRLAGTDGKQVGDQVQRAHIERAVRA